jgi:diaminopimelate epimerase
VVRFTKMQGAGNDFVVFDATKDPIALTPEQIRRLADRHFGIGCDQVLVVEPANDGNAATVRAHLSDSCAIAVSQQRTRFGSRRGAG